MTGATYTGHADLTPRTYPLVGNPAPHSTDEAVHDQRYGDGKRTPYRGK